ncbi:DIS3-like exonuclease 2 [Drosophila grimshawi]|uniref:GH15630 n=1 Tax=Drosophila grimshawi TaxID=7222 RepID=B4J099_DROGR|nr:DIS3-like exonuclease 2 [Drosophila grimshawi]EDV95700.1 GH15630 [Drosophila grimshawi]
MSNTSSLSSYDSGKNLRHSATDATDDYPKSIELLRLRSQKLAVRLQQTQLEMTARQQQQQRNSEQSLAMLMGVPLPAAAPAATATAAKTTTTITAATQNNNHAYSLPAPQRLPMQPAVLPIQVQLQLAALTKTTESVAALQAPAVPGVRAKRKSRSNLKAEVDALKDLIKKLTVSNPGVKAHAQQLISQSEVLCQLDGLLPKPSNGCARAPAAAPATDPNYRQQLQTQAKLQKQQQQRPARRESELSSASSTSEAGAGATSSSAQQDENNLTQRKRNRKRRNGKNLTTSQISELDAMRVYINRIVQQYVGGEEHSLTPELRFEGDFGDLESHARRLVSAGYGRIVEAEIRVNRKNNRQAFITMSTDREALDQDGMVMLPVARRYAFEGDIVRAFVLNAGAVVTKASEPRAGRIIGGKPSISLGDNEELSEEESESPDTEDDNVAVIASDNCPKAFVIAIIKQTELRQIVGSISFTNPTKLGDDELFYKFRPFDLRMPMVYIAQASCAIHIGDRKSDEVCGLLYVAHILETDANGHCIADLVQPVGRVGNLEDELKAILFHNNLRDVVPFEQRFNEMYAQPAAPVGEKDLVNRRDMRKQCVFTIDPLTARDLDDALSIEQLDENKYQIGVHISDVSHYLEENSELDNIVKKRSTSIYLANEVIHMLPQPLCFRCSLLPGEDKYAFSVFWYMDAKGKQLDKPVFTRSVINSCTQFAYEHAQKIIDNPGEQFTADDFPSILNGFSVEDIVKRVTWLNAIARNMRSERFVNGALTINNAKVRFNLDPLSGEPIGFELEKQREANHMIEEFMLLANQAVARFIHDAFPNIAILRHHPPPLTKSLKALREKLLSRGYDLDYSSSKSLQASMQRLCNEANDPVAMTACLSQLLMKPMARANYFCSEGKTEASDLWHYALSIPIYTHFTSPIRRYPDVMVHRLLAAGLNYCPAPQRSTDELHQLTKLANDRKYNAKLAGDESGNLFFKRYVSNRQAIYMRAVVIEIFQHMMNVVTLESGHVISINYKMQRVLIDTHNVPNFIMVAERNLQQKPTKLELLSVIPIRLIIWDGKLTGFLLSAEQRLKGPSMEQPLKDNKKKQQQQQQQQQKSQKQQQIC